MQDLYKAIIHSYVQAYNRFNVPGMIQHFSEDIVFENVSQGTVNLRTEGKAAFVQQAQAALTWFSAREQTITSWLFEGYTVEIGIGYTAVLATDFPNGMKAGDTLHLKGKSVFEFLNGKIVSLCDEA
jgi:hypothetical protein